MKKTATIILIVFLAIFLIIGMIIFITSDGEKSKTVKTDNLKTRIRTDSYEATLYFDKDHYVLSVFTSNIKEKFSFEYDNSEFLLDTTGKVFSKAWKRMEEQKTTYYYDLEPNTLYEFLFIPLAESKLEFNKNLIVK